MFVGRARSGSAYLWKQAVATTLVRSAASSDVSTAAIRVKRTADTLTGQAEVLRAQEVVKELKDELSTQRSRLQNAEENYRDFQNRLKEHYEGKIRVYDSKKRDLVALSLLHKEEIELLQQEQLLEKNVDSLRLRERGSFDALCDSIQHAHEREREHSQRAKTFTAVGSIVSGLLGFIGSYLFLRREIKGRLNGFELMLEDLTSKLNNEDPKLAANLASFNKTLHCHNSTLQDIQATQKSMLKLLEEKLTCHSGDSKLMNYSSREHHGVISASDKNAENENSGAVIWICVGMGLLQMAMTVFVK